MISYKRANYAIKWKIFTDRQKIISLFFIL